MRVMVEFVRPQQRHPQQVSDRLARRILTEFAERERDRSWRQWVDEPMSSPLSDDTTTTR